MLNYLKNYKQFLENYEGTSWSIGNSKITIYDVQEYLKNDPIIEIPVKDIEDKSIFYKEKIDKKTLKRSEESDLKYHIIIIKNINGEYGMILDGHHRLLKAINNNIKTIKAKVLDLENAPQKYKRVFKKK